MWSGDGRWVLLVGERFSVEEPRIKIVGGWDAYLLVDVEKRGVWCNGLVQWEAGGGRSFFG